MMRWGHLPKAPTKMEDDKAKVQDPLEEVNLGTVENPKLVFISKLLLAETRMALIGLLTSYKDYFAWDYTKLFGLDRDLVEHYLPIKPGFKPFQQPLRRMAPKMITQVKVEIEHLYNAKFIQMTRYVIWLSNIVHVIKKNGKLCIYIDFRNLNNVTPKDEYLITVVDNFVDSTIRNAILNFMNGYSGYN